MNIKCVESTQFVKLLELTVPTGNLKLYVFKYVHIIRNILRVYVHIINVCGKASASPSGKVEIRA